MTDTHLPMTIYAVHGTVRSRLPAVSGDTLRVIAGLLFGFAIGVPLWSAVVRLVVAL